MRTGFDKLDAGYLERIFKYQIEDYKKDGEDQNSILILSIARAYLSRQWGDVTLDEVIDSVDEKLAQLNYHELKSQAKDELTYLWNQV